VHDVGDSIRIDRFMVVYFDFSLLYPSFYSENWFIYARTTFILVFFSYPPRVSCDYPVPQASITSLRELDTIWQEIPRGQPRNNDQVNLARER